MLLPGMDLGFNGHSQSGPFDKISATPKKSSENHLFSTGIFPDKKTSQPFWGTPNPETPL